jgi:biopolymer transport protein ExbD
MDPERHSGKDARLQLTSMIDVVFLLLLFFLCSPFKSPEGELDACMPKDRGPHDPPVIVEPEEIFHLSLKYVRNGAPRLLFGSVPIPTDPQSRSGLAEPDFDWLAAKLVDMGRRPDSDVKVEINSDPLVRYGYVVRTLNACTKAGVTDIRFGYPRRS